MLLVLHYFDRGVKVPPSSQIPAGLLPWSRQQLKVWLAKSPNHSKSKNNIRACAPKKSPAFMWRVTRGDEVALACLLLHDPREGDRLEQWLALFAYATLPPPPPPPPPCLLCTLYPTQQKIELTLACGHFTSLEFNPTPLCLSLLGQSVRG